MLSNQNLPLNVFFYDDFDRPDTQAGDLGSPPLGMPYQLMGGIMPEPADSSIVRGRWNPNTLSASYLVQPLRDKVKNIGAKLMWTEYNGHQSDGLFVFLTSPMGAENIAWICNHIRINRYAMSFDVRLHNDTIFTKTIPYPNSLEMNKDYVFDLDFNRGLICYNVVGVMSGMVANSYIDTCSGSFASYEFFFNSGLTTTKPSVASIWAG